ncbi:hypothetical protein TNCV_4864751 [Trichonephila clavipes]|nr:hypothetical protein TNCV_4864751 [Trichonephila clavipes]
MRAFSNGLVVLNYGEGIMTTLEPAPPSLNYGKTLNLDRFNVHRLSLHDGSLVAPGLATLCPREPSRLQWLIYMSDLEEQNDGIRNLGREMHVFHGGTVTGIGSIDAIGRC